MKTAEIISPLVHLNGNSEDSLVGGWDEINDAIEELIATITREHEVFHARNFYPHGNDQADKAHLQGQEFVAHAYAMREYAQVIRLRLHEQTTD